MLITWGLFLVSYAMFLSFSSVHENCVIKDIEDVNLDEMKIKDTISPVKKYISLNFNCFLVFVCLNALNCAVMQFVKINFHACDLRVTILLNE